VKRWTLIIVAALIVIQIPPLLFETNPPVIAEPQWVNPQTRALAQRACFDCHSNETVWPWYSRIAPPSWLVALDVFRGRRHLNFSEWGTASAETRGLSEAVRQIQRGSMPPDNYLLLHPGAALSVAEKQQLIDGLNAVGR
jgi:hypothetical protein